MDAPDDQEELQTWTVSAEQAGERIDKHVTDMLADAAVSRSQVQLWIRDGLVTINGQPAKANVRISENDCIVVQMPEPQLLDVKAEPIELNVVYEDEDVIVIDKPRGMVVHPAAGHPGGTVVNALLHHCRDLSGINGILRPGIVHRIDKDTSGLLMAAKNDLAHVSLAAQLKDHTVDRRYTAIVYGVIPHDRGTIEAPLGRSTQDRKMFTVTTGGKHAVTHFAVLERFADYTYVQLELETGRTHQIRVHMKYIGHPIVGDPVYGGRAGRTLGMQGQALHAGELGFTHPRTGERLSFASPPPADMQEALHILRSR